MRLNITKEGMMDVKRTERGWGGHFIGADSCSFRRNTLLEHEDVKIVVSTVGNYCPEEDIRDIGLNRFYETMAFHSNYNDIIYYDADVSREVRFNSPWSIDRADADDEANDMHENVVTELISKIGSLTREEGNERYKV